MKLSEATYEKLDEEYRSKFSKMSVTPEGVRYLKLRSLIDIKTLKESSTLMRVFLSTKSKISKNKVAELRKQAFLNDEEFPNEQLNNLLKIGYKDLRRVRDINVNGLVKDLKQIAEEGEEYWKAWRGVYRDDIRQHIQHHYVRSTSIQSYMDLKKK